MPTMLCRHGFCCPRHRLATAKTQLHRRATQCTRRTVGDSRQRQPTPPLSATAHLIRASIPHGSSNRQKSSKTVECRSRPSPTCRAASTPPGEAAASGNFSNALRQFVADQFLPIGLLAAMLLGFLSPGPGIKAANAGVQTFTTTGIFIISGLNLKRGEATQALTAWGSILYGLATILLITPLVGYVALRLPLQPPELTFGLTVFCCMPTTLSSAVSLTQTVGGNTALALLLTVSSNLLGVFTMPFVLCRLLGASGSGVTVEPGPLLVNLLKTILAPLLVGACARASIPAVARAVDRNKKRMSLLSSTLLILVPWMQISKAVKSDACIASAAIARAVDSNKKRMSLLSSMLLILVPWMQISKAVKSDAAVSASALLAVLAAGIGIHLVFLAFNLTATSLLQLGKSSTDTGTGIKRACILVGSQKTLPIAVTVLNGLGSQIGGAVGLAVIPCVVSHLVQIVIDSMLVSRWLKQDSAASAGGQQPALNPSLKPT